jgi:hypothetical protein
VVGRKAGTGRKIQSRREKTRRADEDARWNWRTLFRDDLEHTLIDDANGKLE